MEQTKTNRPKVIGVVGVVHETNTFAPGLTGLDAFKNDWIVGTAAFVDRYTGTKTSMGGVIDAARDLGLELRPGFYTQATPSGMVTDDAFNAIADGIADSADHDVDGLVVILHGAMVASSYPDAEGEILRRLRAKFGRSLPMAVTLDLHGNISPEMVDLSDIIVAYDTYPHVDTYDRAVEAVHLLNSQLKGDIKPVQRLVHTRMLVAPQAMLTASGVMKEMMDLAFELEKVQGVLNISVAGGFPYSDVEDAGMTFVVTVDNDPELAERCCEQLRAAAWDRRERFTVQQLEPAEAVAMAVRHPEGPVILIESSDNVGGGSPADATHILPHLLTAPKKSLIVIRDPEAARLAAKHGIGAVLRCAIGGKSDDLHGEPVEIEGRIRTLFDGNYRHIGAYMTGQYARMGLTAVIECGNVTVVLTEERVAPWDPGHVKFVGLQPEQFHMIVVKAAIAWRTAFGDVAKLVIEVDTPGCCTANMHRFRYEAVKRPIYPLDSIE
ncbi:M81 family metallopeptidase [Paenibacillus hemerocallicola]|uniref:M81 family metallopeptidase n=1 Tax=Paenibacillus hemerocallicola TaxID=1172614 RepID=A0A5C4TH33_9BACL|nr:M81 family metallopeptidase [Paenibacillus hemerocallicola]TNJ68288.1 M81 family metallopeptidase [Paenibacillus hemerocallicola]